MLTERMIIERKADLIRLLEETDITYSMYKNAVEKYEAIVNVLKNSDIDAHIYPQGSFAIGTVVKPQRKSRNTDYDLDVICQVSYSKSSITATRLYEMVKKALENDGRYKGKLEFFEECITIHYAEISNCSFSMDIVPSVPEDSGRILLMKGLNERKDLCDTAIAITKSNNCSLEWGTSNPEGYKNWFNEINEKFHNYGYNTNRRTLFEKDRYMYVTADDVPKHIVKTPLQKVVQLLKLHKNTYFSNPKVENYKVKSVIIATLVANRAAQVPEYYDTFQLLDYVLKDLSSYSALRTNHVSFIASQPTKNIIKYNGKEWQIANPSNPFDNLADSWNEDNNYVEFFFRWLTAAIKDFGSILGEQDSTFGTNLVKMFGENAVKKSGYDKKYNLVPPTPINTQSQNKPWSDDE